MQRAEILIDGEVQGVGYRYYVRRAAKKYKLVGNVENLEDGRVKIICEGEKSSIKAFLEDINIREPPIFVESIEHKFSKATGEFKGFRIVTGKLEEEMVEGFSTGMAYLQSIGGKQDETVSELREFREESKMNFGGLKTEIRGFKEESNANFQALDEKYHAVSNELRSINQNIEKLAESISKSNELLVKLVERYIAGEKGRRK